MVSLRQIQRKATREKERNQELRRLQDEARKEEGQRLTQRLKELERALGDHMSKHEAELGRKLFLHPRGTQCCSDI